MIEGRASPRPRRATPVVVSGMSEVPPAGELARVVANDREARDIANRRGERLRREQRAAVRPRGVSLEGLYEQLQAGEVSDLNLVVRGDVVGSVEAVVSELSKFEHPEVRLNVIAEGVGAITQNDIMLASASDALIVGFNVRPNAEASRARGARGRRDPHLRRHLQAHRGDRAGARRQARRRQDRGDDRRGRGAGRSSASPGSARSPAAWSPTVSSVATGACA